ncbi:roadblock/LC7 domain-containing protein [Streptomyces avicenniae]|uniref:roadblock/LC7 domain-containing protein n=1 Tax=Streptomyces avicenniae TaxID=500153 RepID=UPI00069B7D98|nr:roadblock/LC7 domain-containing protein [Streptomyces avicenniae]
MNSHAAPDLSWILDELVSAPGARHAVLLSADGLATAGSAGVDRDMADRVSAIASGMQSLSRSGAGFVSDDETPWQQTMVSYKDGFLFVIAAAEGSFLVASAGASVDVGAFSYQMAKTVERLGDELAVAPRQPQTERA